MDNAKKVQIIEALDALGIDVRSWSDPTTIYPNTAGGTMQTGAVTLVLAVKATV